MKLPLITPEEKRHADEHLNKTYNQGLIPPEKKSWLTQLSHCLGPYLAVESSHGQPHYLLDAASQITSLGLGFNPSAFFLPAHYSETWLNHPSKEISRIRDSFHCFLARKLQTSQVYTTLCHSGAEANEIALGYCFRKRQNSRASKVLAFKGSFHGRMLVSLFSSWNPQKREPFQWPQYETVYVNHPSLPDNQIIRDIPKNWFINWEASLKKNFRPPQSWNKDPQMKKEVDCLMEVRKQLLTGEIYAVIIEPMQCEGGDNYSSNRFHGALLAMAKNFRVPTIYDEIQTGFHLGNLFFWHSQFNLNRRPDYITCAKRAQVGIVISFEAEEKEKEEYNLPSFLRGIAHATCLDQHRGKISLLEQQTKPLLEKLIKSHKDLFECPRILGLAFAFDCKDKTMVNKMVAARFDFGMLFYPAGEKTLRFRLNLSYKEDDLHFLFDRLDAMTNKIFHGKTPTLSSTAPARESNELLYQWQNFLLAGKLSLLQGKKLQFDTQFSSLKKLCSKKLFIIDEKNFSQYKQKIQELEKRIYEPARQTDIEKFQSTAEDSASVCLGMKEGDDLIAIAFAAPLSKHPSERGVRKDPDFDNPRILYALDLTVDNKYQGQGLGRQLKYALFSLAQTKGHESIRGNNRDQLAAGMHTVNLSLGAWELYHQPWAYQDDKEFCDAIYYSSPLVFSHPKINLSNAVRSPLEMEDIDESFIKKQLPYLVNKTTLSNFVDRCFLETIEKIFHRFPESLRHGYTASGQSEAVDKIIKSIWFKDNKNTLSLSFEGHFFGSGSFLSRSLSGIQSYFPVKHLPHPISDNEQDILHSVEEELKTKKISSVWIEPLLQKSMKRVSETFLTGLKKRCIQYKTPLIYNETASALYRYGKKIYCGEDNNLTPHAMMVYLGGQASVIGVDKNLFVDKPLTMISTWDGDQASLLNFLKGMEKIEKNPALYFNIRTKFHKKIIKDLQDYPVTIHMDQGMGFIKGNLPSRYEKIFDRIKDRYLVCPSYSAIRRYLDD